MVKNYKRKTDRGKWSEESMKNAVSAVIEGRMGYKLAAKTFFVPQTTLERKVNQARENPETTKALKVPLGPKVKVFSDAEELELCNYILDMESRLYGLTTKDLRSLVYRLAVQNNKSHPFNNVKQEAGKDWVQSFLKRHPELSIRQPESTSAARAAGFNKQAVQQFFTFLGNVYDEHQLTPDRVFNCDETGISVVPKKKSKIIAKKGRKQVGTITSAERGQTVTVEICFSASGNYMPPMMIFPRKKKDPQLMLKSAPGAWQENSESGWMTTDIFLRWFKKFVEFSGASQDRPVLLLLDGHSTHTQNIELINEARSCGVIILCFPPHTTHRLQVADVVFMRPLSTYYDQQITAWLRSNPGMVVTIRQVAEIFGKAFIQAASMATAVNGFKKCGIWPFDPTVFSEHDFAPSLTTDIPLEIINSTQTTEITFQPVKQLAPSSTEEQSFATVVTAETVTVESENVTNSNSMRNKTTAITIEFLDKVPTSSSQSPSSAIIDQDITSLTIPTCSTTGCSSWVNSELEIRSKTPEPTSFPMASPKQIMPLPATKKTSRPTKKRGKTAIITSSPYKKELENTITKKKLAEELKKKRKEMKELRNQSKIVKKRQTKKKTVAKARSQSESDSDVENTPCLYCEGRYLDSNEGWAACSSCHKWAHCSCAGIDDEDEDAIFTCEFCE